MLQDWIDSVNDDPLAIKKADLVAEGLIDFIMYCCCGWHCGGVLLESLPLTPPACVRGASPNSGKSKQYNEFFTELVRQTRVHCPKVAR